MENAPCKDCKDRHEACHDKCEKYKAFRDKNIAVNKAITEFKKSVYNYRK